MDSITKGQRNLLLFILGIAILVVPIRFFAMDNFSAKKDLESQKNDRQTYYNELKAKDANRQQYIEDTEKYTKQYQEVIAKFYIKTGDYRMTLDEVTIAFNDQTGKYEGDMTITSYAVNGEDRTTDHADVNVQIGTNNIFGNPTVKSTTSTSAE